MGASGLPSPQMILDPCLSRPHSSQCNRFSGVASSGHNEAQKSVNVLYPPNSYIVIFNIPNVSTDKSPRDSLIKQTGQLFLF